MEHIVERHMLPVPQRTSYFLSHDEHIVRGMVTATHERPDHVTPHWSERDRIVLRRTFSTQVGVHGITREACYSVTLIVDAQSYAIVTGFPTK